MAKNSTTIARWLRPFVFPVDITKATLPTHIEVFHVNVNDKTAPVHTFNLESVDENNLISLVRDIDETLTTDADGLSGVQRYMLICCCGYNDDQQKLGRLPIRYRGESQDAEEDALSSEPATAKGLVAQSQRHTEAFARMAMAQTASISTIQERMISRLAEMNERLMDKHVEVITLIEDLSSQKHLRDLEAKKQEGKDATRAMMVKQVLPMLATVVRKYTGATIPGGASAPEMLQIRTLLEGLSEEQQEAMLSILTPAQTVAWVSLMDDLEAKDKEANNTNSGH